MKNYQKTVFVGESCTCVSWKIYHNASHCKVQYRTVPCEYASHYTLVCYTAVQYCKVFYATTFVSHHTTAFLLFTIYL